MLLDKGFPGFSAAQSYSVAWSGFDNATGQKRALAGRASFDLPEEVARAGNETYYAAEIRGSDAKKTLTVYLRKRSEGVEVVGVDRAW